MNNVMLYKQSNTINNNDLITIKWIYIGKNSEGYDHWMGVPEHK